MAPSLTPAPQSSHAHKPGAQHILKKNSSFSFVQILFTHVTEGT